MSDADDIGAKTAAVAAPQRPAPGSDASEVSGGVLPEKIGPYRVTGQLGEGGMGEVYYDDRLDRPVALKRIRPESGDSHTQTRFRHEAKAVAHLSHSAIVQVYDWVEAEGCDWIVMELVDGRPLNGSDYYEETSVGEFLLGARSRR